MRRYTVPILSSIGLFLIILVVRFATQVIPADPLVDPFDSYSAIMPGEPMTALSYFSCSSALYDDYIPEGWNYCWIYPSDGPIRLIGVTSKDSQIVRVVFMVKEIPFGTIVQRWGSPDKVSQRPQHYSAHWDEGIFVASDIPNWFTYQSPVSIVSMSIQPLGSTI